MPSISLTISPPANTSDLLRILLAALLLPLAFGLSRSSGPCSHPPPCLLLEEATCRAELAPGPEGPRWRARYFAADGSEVSCSSDSLLLCEGKRHNISCPRRLSIKIWFAAFKRAPPSFCSAKTTADPPSTRSPASCVPRSALWELAGMCDGRPHCVINTSALVKDGHCRVRGARYLRTEYSCVSNSESYSQAQLQFFFVILLGIISFFGVAVTALLITVHFKKQRDAFPLTSIRAPLTENENPEM